MSYDWIPIALPQKFEVVDASPLSVAATELELSSGSELSLRVTMKAAGRAKQEVRPGAGSQIEGVSVLLRDEARHAAVLRGFYSSDTRTTDNGGVTSTIEGRAESLEVSYHEGDAAAIVDWLTNAPDTIWPRTTERSETVTTRRERDGEDIVDERDGQSMTSDHVRLQLGLPSLQTLLVGSVPSDLLEVCGVSRPGFMEFRRGERGLPDEHLRRTVRRACEFLFGCGLGVLGCSELDADGKVLRAAVRVGHVPGGSGARLQPGLLHPRYKNGIDEQVVEKLVRRYIELEALYGLNRAVWLYLHARGAPFEMAAAYVGSAFEILVRGYFEQPENESRSRLVPRTQWKQVQKSLSAALDDVAGNAEMSDHADAIASIKTGMSMLNNVSGTRLQRLFLDDLGLQHGEVEKRALKARNDAAHGNELDESNLMEAFRAYRGLHTLFARALLSLLGSELGYFDYSAISDPVRALTDKQGASNGVGHGSL